METVHQTQSTTNITDVNIDCLERIFERLALTDLLNIADYNHHLRKAAELVFIRLKYGKRLVKLEDYTHFENGLTVETDDKIYIKDVKTCLRYLRCFGHLMAKLTFHIRSKSNSSYIGEYLSEYCANTLNEITFEIGIWHDFSKPFSNVHKVRFVDHCHLTKKQSRFNEWFPQMRILEFVGKTEIVDRKCIANHFPHLEHLAIEEFQKFSDENLLNAIRLNPNLKSLRLHWNWQANVLRTVSEQLPKLESLQIDCYVEEASNFVGDPIHFENVKKLKILFFRKFDCSGRFRGTNSLPKIPLTFVALKEFSLQADFRLDERFFDFITKHPTITRLNLKVDRVCNQIFSDKMKIGRALPLLTDVNFNHCRFSVSAAIRFLDEFKMIDTFSFTLSDLNQFDNLQTRLTERWQATIDFFAGVKLYRS